MLELMDIVNSPADHSVSCSLKFSFMLLGGRKIYLLSQRKLCQFAYWITSFHTQFLCDAYCFIFNKTFRTKIKKLMP